MAPPSGPAGFLAALLVAALTAGPDRAQGQVFQIQGGASSLVSGYGGLVNIWGNGYEASIGVGYLDGIRVGAAARHLMGGRDTLRLGNDMLPVVLETDVFHHGGSLFAQGASIQRRRGRTQVWAFGGASATALAAPMFASQRATRAMAYVRARQDVTRDLNLSMHVVATDRQSLLASATWEPSLGTTAGATLGTGSNAPYGALSFLRRSPTLDVKASLIGLGAGFRRASAPMPLQSEIERENLLVTWKPHPGWSLGAGRQHFHQDSVFPGIAARATLNQLTASASIAGASLAGGWLVSEAGESPNVSSYFSMRDEVFSWLHGEFYLLNVWRPTPARTSTPVLLLREMLTPQLALLQVITRDQGRTSVSLGGALNSGLSSISVDYQVAHSPYLTTEPFVQTMGVNVRFHIFGLTLSLGTFVTPDGRVHYSGQGSTFMYHGMTSRSGAPDAGRRFDRFIVRGRVVDEGGQPVDGAALEIGGEMVYTDSQGRFFRRCSTDRALPVRVVMDDFLVPGAFAIESAPSSLDPVPEHRAREVVVVLRRLGAGVKPD